jgi:heptosyltransferase-2
VDRAQFRDAKKILVIGVNWVGDTVLSLPAMRGLRRLFPGVHIGCLAKAFLGGLLREIPDVDEVIPYHTRTGFNRWADELRMVRALRRRRFDVALILPRSLRSALVAYLAGIPVRVGYVDEGRGFLLTHGIARTDSLLRLHRTEYYLHLIECMGGVAEGDVPVIKVAPELRRWAHRYLRSCGMEDIRPLVGFNPGATYGSAKCWDPFRFSALGTRLCREHGAGILIFGSQGERELAAMIARGIEGKAVNLAGSTTLPQLAALMGSCDVVVTNDTGPMHISAAVKTPVVAIFGSTDPVSTGPRGNGHIIVRKDVSCSPCLKRVCPIDHRCMDLISTGDVLEALNRIIGRD